MAPGEVTASSVPFGCSTQDRDEGNSTGNKDNSNSPGSEYQRDGSVDSESGQGAQNQQLPHLRRRSSPSPTRRSARRQNSSASTPSSPTPHGSSPSPLLSSSEPSNERGTSLCAIKVFGDAHDSSATEATTPQTVIAHIDTILCLPVADSLRRMHQRRPEAFRPASPLF